MFQHNVTDHCAESWSRGVAEEADKGARERLAPKSRGCQDSWAEVGHVCGRKLDCSDLRGHLLLLLQNNLHPSFLTM